MPELPEVETLKRQLKILPGKKIKIVKVDWPKTVKPLSIRQWQLLLKNKTIKRVARQAKVLILALSDKSFLLTHLKMTGQLIYKPGRNVSSVSPLYKRGESMVIGGHPQVGGADNLPNKFTRVIIEFTDGSFLYFNDMRKFGWMRRMNSSQMKDFFSGFGVDVLSAKFNLNYFQTILERYPKRKIKQVLMDQKLLAGIGNIYADESCFAAGLLPTRLAGNLTSKETINLYNHIKRIIKLAVAKKGTSFRDYVHSDGQPGGFAPYLQVYGRGGERCKRRGCAGKIDKIKIGGRGTHFCKICQK